MNKNSFPSLQLQKEYRSPQHDVANEFFAPVLACSKIYKRSVGFFSSTSLEIITKGVSSLVKNGGKIQIVASPKLSEEDIEAIKTGYDKKSEIIEKRLLGELETKEENYFANQRLNLLANLIAKDILSIKIAFKDNGNLVGIYHEKLGVFEDFEGNKIAFDGSMNESKTAMCYNYESINVYCGWLSEDKSRVELKIKAFDNIWNNTEENLKVVEFPSVTKKILDKYKTKNLDVNEITEKLESFDKEDRKKSEYKICHTNLEGTEELKIAQDENEENTNNFFNFNDGKSPRPYQQKAVEKFCEDNFQCLFAMATGTGKTLTSLFAANELSNRIKLNTILIIVPLKDLVDQWEEDVQKYFHGEIITIRSGLDWKEKLSELNVLSMLNKESRKVVLITTYDSFSINDEKILALLKPKDSLIIADEVHKFGASTYSKKLPQNIIYRLGLSATPKRAYDDKGTAAVYDYFCPSQKPFEFSIKDAIEADMLCHYVYKPILVPLNDDETDNYSELSEQISKLSVYLNNSNHPKKEDEEILQNLLINRHRIIERANGKLERFVEIMREEILKYKDKTIIFCPAGKDENGKDYLEIYKNSLWSALASKGKIIRMNEYIQGTEKKIIDDFTNGFIDILFAKQRLNEGIDIPAARRAFFIASSTSEREFIQRRGRVLRKSPGKTKAEVFDFIVIPSDKNYKYASSITTNEIKRAMDFAVTADNYSEIENKLKEYL